MSQKSESSKTPDYTPKSSCTTIVALDQKNEASIRERLDDRWPTTCPAQQLKSRPSWARFCLHWLTPYRILIAVTFAANAIVGGFISRTKPSSGQLLTATATNLLVSVLVRQEDLLNVSFGLIAKIPSTLPLSIRKVIADFHHYGGVHIGCAVSSLLWYCLFIVVNTRDCIRISKAGSMTKWHWIDIATCYIFLLSLLVICLIAIPRLRERLHNSFERSHRFGGWFALALLWTNTGIRTQLDSPSKPLYTSPSLWLLAATTFLIILPWLRMYRVPIRATPISSRDIKLTFPFANMPYTSTARFSLSPLLEWHAFATVPSRDGFSADIIISAAGDWTKDVIAHPPTHMYIRTPPTANFLTFTPLFNSVLLVATGAGIGPMLSLFSSPAIARMKEEGKTVRVMWCAYEPYAPHWADVLAVIQSVDPLPKIFDSKQGRPDVAFEARYLAHVEELEAVMIVSNKKVTDEVVREVKGFGGAAYGAVFDS
ncbi:hypothetical protein IQ06DRAFT_353818 [Phaeosphaeriaceae sp. SRC1lsM3a]|nr:hypothetical protein IQ06DRAFT_353818 [Stagonospora sp. SRC1lsM3a]